MKSKEELRKQRQAQREERYAERKLIKGRLVYPNPPGGHGSTSTYTGYGCRCFSCSKAMSIYSKEAGLLRRTR